MNRLAQMALVLALGIMIGMSVSPLLAQSRSAETTCFVGEGSNAACSGKWIYFAGNTANLDESAWIVRIDADTGAIWYKNGKRLVLLGEPD